MCISTFWSSRDLTTITVNRTIQSTLDRNLLHVIGKFMSKVVKLYDSELDRQLTPDHNIKLFQACCDLFLHKPRTIDFCEN